MTFRQTKKFRLKFWHVIAKVVCLCLLIGAVTPPALHTPSVIETLNEHAQMVAEHGHSHGLEQDLYWAAHGHSHDAKEHDHNTLALAFSQFPTPSKQFEKTINEVTPTNWPLITFSWERPPRV